MISHTKSFAPRQVLLTSAPQEILSPSDRRYAVIIAPPAQGVAYIGADPSISIGSGIPLYFDSQPLVLIRDVVGDLVRRGLWAVGLNSFGANRDFVTNKITASSNGAGLVAVTLVCPASSYIEVDGIACSVNKDEITNLALTDAAPLTYVNLDYKQSFAMIFNPPLFATAGANVFFQSAASATSTQTSVNVWGRTVISPTGLSNPLNLSIIEIFDCDCASIDDIKQIAKVYGK